MNVKLWKGSRNDLSDPIGTIMENRGVEDYKTYMNLDDSCLNSSWELDNMEDAVRLLNKHIWNKSIISILVDCDVDGFTSASMMFQYLKTIGYFGKSMFCIIVERSMDSLKKLRSHLKLPC